MTLNERNEHYHTEMTKLVILALRRLLDDLKVIKFRDSSFDSITFIKKYKV